MRALILLSVLILAGCGDVWNRPATPATSGVSANGDGSTNMNGGGGVRSFSATGSAARFGR